MRSRAVGLQSGGFAHLPTDEILINIKVVKIGKMALKFFEKLILKIDGASGQSSFFIYDGTKNCDSNDASNDAFL